MSERAGEGRIITFYSYKGGTGRSMALANVAWILASAGRRVLAIDWDFEAPGLHRYFHPFIEDPELHSTPGLIDFFVDFATAARLDHKRTTPAGTDGARPGDEEPSVRALYEHPGIRLSRRLGLS